MKQNILAANIWTVDLSKRSYFRTVKEMQTFPKETPQNGAESITYHMKNMNFDT